MGIDQERGRSNQGRAYNGPAMIGASQRKARRGILGEKNMCSLTALAGGRKATRRDAVCTRSRVKGETHAYWAERVEAEAHCCRKARTAKAPSDMAKKSSQSARALEAAAAERPYGFGSRNSGDQ